MAHRGHRFHGVRSDLEQQCKNIIGALQLCPGSFRRRVAFSSFNHSFLSRAYQTRKKYLSNLLGIAYYILQNPDTKKGTAAPRMILHPFHSGSLFLYESASALLSPRWRYTACLPPPALLPSSGWRASEYHA